MDFSLSEVQRELERSVARFAETQLGGDVRERDRTESFFREGFTRCAEMGLFGLPIPETYGGTGQGIVECLVTMQTLGRHCHDAGLVFAVGSHVFTCEIPILLFGSEEQKERLLPRLVKGELVGCHAVTEPEAGSDAFSLRTRATKVEGGYRLTGEKTFVTNAPIADVFIVFATVNPKKGWAGVTAFLVERGAEGFGVGKPLSKLGLRTSPTGTLSLDECFVPDSAVLGRVGGGSAIFSAEMEWERCCLFGAKLGAMQRQLDKAVTYAKERKQFGKPIGSFQGVSHRIADMRLRIELAELSLYKVAWLKSQGKRTALEGAIAKLYVSESFVASSLDAVQVHGGYGYMTDVEVERDLRDAVGGTLYSGTSEIQRNVIASLLGLDPR